MSNVYSLFLPLEVIRVLGCSCFQKLMQFGAEITVSLLTFTVSLECCRNEERVDCLPIQLLVVPSHTDSKLQGHAACSPEEKQLNPLFSLVVLFIAVLVTT